MMEIMDRINDCKGTRIRSDEIWSQTMSVYIATRSSPDRVGDTIRGSHTSVDLDVARARARVCVCPRMRSPPSVVGHQVTGSACRRQCWTLICRVRLFSLYRLLPSTSVQRQIMHISTIYVNVLAMRRVELRGSVPELAWREVENYFGKKILSTPKRDPNPDIPVIGSLVQHDNDALHHAVTEVVMEVAETELTMEVTEEAEELPYLVTREDNTTEWKLPIDMVFNSGNVVSIVTYSILLIISSVGNITVLIILRRKKTKRSRINLLLMHLAIADLFVSCRPM
uniref:G-protein coupled receptors family 1 profile domain-containing protein n=1 Tax=Timema tahoe TaxID=61484 RepID=A0A7R9FLI3_9NEOP|nr:unnamed protein product [Timema tahoe]